MRGRVRYVEPLLTLHLHVSKVMCWQAKLRKAEEQANERFFAALSSPTPLPPLMAVVGSKLAAGVSYWPVKPLEPPYVLNPEITAPLPPFYRTGNNSSASLLQDRKQLLCLLFLQDRHHTSYEHTGGRVSIAKTSTSTRRLVIYRAPCTSKVPSPALSLLARCFLITLCQLQGSSSFDT